MIGGYLLATLPTNRQIDPWVEAVLRLNLRGRRHVLRRRFKPPMSWFLYKYCSADRAYFCQNLRDVIVGSVLRLNSAGSFNDPFEMTAHFIVKATEREKLARFEALVRQQAPHVGWRAIQAAIQRLIATPEEGLRPMLNEPLRRIRDAAGIYCFSGEPRSTLMWSRVSVASEWFKTTLSVRAPSANSTPSLCEKSQTPAERASSQHISTS